jgi:cob(I)alamin adenosyltransferase
MRGARLHIYFGDGQGKTSAALGSALRAWGRGWRVLFVQFLKERRAVSGESDAAQALGSRFLLLRSALPAPVLADPGVAGRRALRAASRDLLERALLRVRSGRFDLVVLDEVLVACHYRFLSVASLRGAVRSAAARGAQLVVLTGRWAPLALLREADLVTEMRKVRHPFDRGTKAEHGIEY